MDGKDFFISYTKADQQWAEWIAWTLEEAGYSVLIQAWDFLPGSNFAIEMQQATTLAQRIVIVLSEAFLNSDFTQPEWAAAFAKDPTGEKRLLIPVRVAPCKPEGILPQIVYIDLVNVPEDDAKTKLVKILQERAKPSVPPKFPGSGSATPSADRSFPKMVAFPGKGPQISLTHLPPGTENFVGREKELQRLDDAWAAGETVNALSLVAFGGVGKSALVQAWLDRLQARDWDGAERVFGWSFYSQGSREATESADPFLEHIYRWLGAGEPPTTPEEKGETLAGLLAQGRTLLILDGLEPLQLADGRVQDRALAALLRSLLYHNPGLCLITTRVPVLDLADRSKTTAPRIDLEQLGTDAGVALLRHYEIKGLDEELKSAVQKLGGHALALTLAGTYLREYEKGEIGKLAEIEWLDGEIPEGDHALRMLAAYEAQLGEVERSILRLLGLFDRPAPEGAVACLREEPPIPGLTEGLTVGNDHAWKRALARLRKLRLVVEEEDPVRAQTTLDAHPLVRQYFAERLREDLKDAWQQANERLYQWYQKQAPDLPDTLDQMLPLFQAVVHGCRAGKHQEAFEEVYRRRIHRGKEFYSLRKLGAYTSELVTLAGLFERPWGRPAPGLSPADQAFLLNQAAFDLRAIGRLREAAEPMQVSLESFVDLRDWKNAGQVATNLSELLLTLGEAREAVTAGRRGVELADMSGDLFLRMIIRTALAEALHQSAPPGSFEVEEAAVLFAEAEALQKEFQPDYPHLYSLRGYRYCDLLLGDTPNRESAEAVRERAQEWQSWRTPGDPVLDISSEHLTLGRAAFHLAMLGEEDFTVAARELDAAVVGLRQAGQVDYLARGLLARARLFRQLQNWDKAARDLEEVRSIAERGSMCLFLADYHLEARELARGLGEDDKAKEHEGKARELIEATGYGRRRAALEDP